MSSLTRIVPWSQQLACEVLRPGDLAVDLTAGKGRDTLALAQAVGSQGQVVAIDLQKAALVQTAALLKDHGLMSTDWTDRRPVPNESGIFLVHGCHSRLGQFLHQPARVIMANLGYLPGGDHKVMTRPESTRAALDQALPLLARGGRLVVTVYPAHAGAGEEVSVVDDFFTALPCDRWQVLLLRVANRCQAPYLLVAERLRGND